VQRFLVVIDYNMDSRRIVHLLAALGHGHEIVGLQQSAFDLADQVIGHARGQRDSLWGCLAAQGVKLLVILGNYPMGFRGGLIAARRSQASAESIDRLGAVGSARPQMANVVRYADAEMVGRSPEVNPGGQ
jgi:hypothetical protein